MQEHPRNGRLPLKTGFSQDCSVHYLAHEVQKRKLRQKPGASHKAAIELIKVLVIKISSGPRVIKTVILAEINERTTTPIKKLATNDADKSPKTAVLADLMLREQPLKPSKRSKARTSHKGAHQEIGQGIPINAGGVHVLP